MHSVDCALRWNQDIVNISRYTSVRPVSAFEWDGCKLEMSESRESSKSRECREDGDLQTFGSVEGEIKTSRRILRDLKKCEIQKT